MLFIQRASTCGFQSRTVTRIRSVWLGRRRAVAFANNRWISQSWSEGTERSHITWAEIV